MNLRVSVFYLYGVFDMILFVYLFYILCIGSFRISVFMKEFLRRLFDFDSLKFCSFGNGKVKFNKMDSMRGDYVIL